MKENYAFLSLVSLLKNHQVCGSSVNNTPATAATKEVLSDDRAYSQKNSLRDPCLLILLLLLSFIMLLSSVERSNIHGHTG